LVCVWSPPPLHVCVLPPPGAVDLATPLPELDVAVVLPPLELVADVPPPAAVDVAIAPPPAIARSYALNSDNSYVNSSLLMRTISSGKLKRMTAGLVVSALSSN